MHEQLELIHGDVVKYRNKTGIFLGLVKHTKRYKGRQLAYVQLDGNRRVSKVNYHEIVLFVDSEDSKLKNIGNHRSPFGIGS